MNGSNPLNAQTVLRDTAANQLIGGSGHDWFWLSYGGTATDVLGGYTSGEAATLATA